jgi:hypothetical protein
MGRTLSGYIRWFGEIFTKTPFERAPQNIKDAFDLGYLDYDHEPRRSNPYRPGSDLSDAWDNGFKEREMELNR